MHPIRALWEGYIIVCWTPLIKNQEKRPYSFYQYRCETGYCIVEWDRVGLHNDYGLLTGILHI